MKPPAQPLRYLARFDCGLASSVRALVAAALLLGAIPVVLPLGLLGLWLAGPLLGGLALVRVALAASTHLATKRWGGAVDDSTGAATRAAWVDVGFVLSIGAVADALWRRTLEPGAALGIAATVALAIAPRGRSLWSTLCAALLAVACAWRYQELGAPQTLIVHEPLWLLTASAGLIIHTASSAFRRPAAEVPADDPRGIRRRSPLGWVLLSGLFVAALWRLDSPIAFALHAALVWLVLRLGMELIIALPWRLERAMSADESATAESALTGASRHPSEGTVLAVSLVVAWLELGGAAGTWTQLMAASSAMWCAPSSNQACVFGRYRAWVWGFTVALAATVVSAAVESVPAQAEVYLIVIALIAAWLLSAADRDVSRRASTGS